MYPDAACQVNDFPVADKVMRDDWMASLAKVQSPAPPKSKDELGQQFTASGADPPTMLDGK